jgi:hypothetical protein
MTTDELDDLRQRRLVLAAEEALSADAIASNVKRRGSGRYRDRGFDRPRRSAGRAAI